MAGISPVTHQTCGNRTSVFFHTPPLIMIRMVGDLWGDSAYVPSIESLFARSARC